MSLRRSSCSCGLRTASKSTSMSRRVSRTTQRPWPKGMISAHDPGCDSDRRQPCGVDKRIPARARPHHATGRGRSCAATCSPVRAERHARQRARHPARPRRSERAEAHTHPPARLDPAGATQCLPRPGDGQCPARRGTRPRATQSGSSLEAAYPPPVPALACPRSPSTNCRTCASPGSIACSFSPQRSASAHRRSCASSTARA